MGNIIRETKDKIKIEASILDKFFGRVTVNVGADLGLTKGSTFNVMKQQKDIIDSKSGEVLRDPIQAYRHRDYYGGTTDFCQRENCQGPLFYSRRNEVERNDAVRWLGRAINRLRSI